MKKLTVSIGIPSYFAEKNIKRLLESLITQTEKNQKIVEILVYSDGSLDKTVSEAKRVKDKRIKVIDAKKRNGMIYGMFYMFKHFKGDIFVLLNDDIKLTSSNVIDNLLTPFLKDKETGLVGGNPRPLKARTFTERATISAFNTYDKSRLKFRNGRNKYTCDGKIMAMSRDFIKTIDKTLSISAYGCVDVYIYFSCIVNGFAYRYARDAVVWFRAPDNIADFISLTSRNNTNIYLLEKKFGKIVNKEYSIPKKYLYFEKAKEVLKHPIPATAAFVLGQYCNSVAKRQSYKFNAKWNIVKSTKNLD